MGTDNIIFRFDFIDSLTASIVSESDWFVEACKLA